MRAFQVLLLDHLQLIGIRAQKNICYNICVQRKKERERERQTQAFGLRSSLRM